VVLCDVVWYDVHSFCISAGGAWYGVLWCGLGCAATQRVGALLGQLVGAIFYVGCSLLL
jgi:hypothetical protein